MIELDIMSNSRFTADENIASSPFHKEINFIGGVARKEEDVLKTTKTVEEVLQNFTLNFFHFRLMWIGGLAFLSEAIEVQFLIFLTTCAGNEFNLTLDQRASIASCVFGGMFFGGLVWGRVADALGRRPTFIIATAIIAIAGYLSGISTNYQTLCLFRGLVGFGTGSIPVPFDLMSEFLSKKFKSQMLLFVCGFMWTVGGMIIVGLAWAQLEKIGWRGLAFVAASPMAFASIISIVYLPESPKWLLSKGRNNDAKAMILEAARVAGVKLSPFTYLSNEDDEGEKILANVQRDSIIGSNGEAAHANAIIEGELVNAEKRRISFIGFIFAPTFLLRFLMMGVIWFCFGFAYYGMLLYAGRLFSFVPASNLTCDFNYEYLFIAMIGQMLGFFACVSLVSLEVNIFLMQTLLYAIGGVFAALSGTPGLSLGVLTLFVLLSVANIYAGSNATWLCTRKPRHMPVCLFIFQPYLILSTSFPFPLYPIFPSPHHSQRIYSRPICAPPVTQYCTPLEGLGRSCRPTW